MEALKTKLASVTISNLTLVVVCALAIYLFRVRQSYILVPQWRKDLDTEMYYNGKFPGPEEILLPPIVTDLESDGTNEIVLLTNDMHLEVLVLPAEGPTKKLPLAETSHVTRLPILRDEDGRPSWPVAMTTGYLTEFQSVAQVRKQIIVIVLDSWDVLCYNYQLELLWQQKLMDVGQMREDYQVKSMGVLVTAHSLAKGTQGTVIVGGSFGPKGHVARSLPRGNSKKVRMQQMGGSMHEEEDDPYTHFSTFALCGGNGSVQWHHLPGDFQAEPKKTVKDHYHWKLALKHGSWHTGQSHWSKFGGNLLEHLPHQWSDLHDTTLDLAHLKKSEAPSSAKEDQWFESTTLAELIGIDGDHMIGYAYGGLPPHTPQEHVKHPNTLIVHNHQGLEVLDLASGQPLTQIPMPDTKASYADVDSDKASVEIVRTAFGTRCRAEVFTVYPKAKSIFVGPLCESPTMTGVGLFGAVFNTGPTKVNEDTHLAIPPLALQRVAPKKGMLNHLMGGSLHSSRQGYDTIYLTSTGHLTSYGPTGDFNWQVTLPVLWSDQTRKSDTLGEIYRNSEAGEIYHQSFRPSLLPLSLQVFGKQTNVLAMGWNSMAIVDLRDGYLLAEHSLPCQPMQKPVAADFNNDGWTDVIIICPSGFVGFSLHQQSGYLYTTLISTTVILVICLLSWCCTPEHELEDDEHFCDHYEVG